MTNNGKPHKSLKVAYTMNLVVPGLGQLYLGQIALGSSYMVSFVSSLVAALVLFLRSYGKYLELCTGGRILEGDFLEQLSHTFPVGWLISLAVLGVVICVASLVSLRSPNRMLPLQHG